MDWRDDSCFLCARMDPSICCLFDQQTNKWIKESHFQDNLISYATIMLIWEPNLPEIFYLSSHYWCLLCQFSDLFGTTTQWWRHFSDTNCITYTLQKLFDVMVNWFVCLFHQLFCLTDCKQLQYEHVFRYREENVGRPTTFKEWSSSGVDCKRCSAVPPPTVYCAINTGHLRLPYWPLKREYTKASHGFLWYNKSCQIWKSRKIICVCQWQGFFKRFLKEVSYV